MKQQTLFYGFAAETLAVFLKGSQATAIRTFSIVIRKSTLLFAATLVIATLFGMGEATAQNTAPYWSLAGNTATINSKLGTTNAIPVRVFTKNLERLRIDTLGNVGIGTPAPEGKLHIFRGNAGTVTANADASLVVENFTHNYINLLAPSSAERGILFGDNLNPQDGGIVYEGSTNDMHFRTNGNVTRMNLTAGGNLGLGTIAPKGNLHIFRGSAGTVTPDFNAPLIIENSGNNYINLLTPSAGERGILFGDNLNPQDGGIVYVGSNNNMHFRTNGNITRMNLTANGNLGIGTLNPQYPLSVNGTIQAKEVRVETGWADYVFDDNYKLMSIDELERFVLKNKHLPGIATAKDIRQNGLAVAEMQTKMMEKIEELTLYVIRMNKKIESLQQENAVLKTATLNPHK